MSPSRLRIALLSGCLALAACGGGGGGTTPSVPAGSGGTAMGKASFSFFIPAAASTSAHAKRAEYLPATTQSVVVVVINPNGTIFGSPVIANVTGTNCPAVAGGLQCSVIVPAPQGQVLISVVAYDSLNGTGTPLSAGYTATTIGSGTTAVTITLSGAAAYLATSLSGGGLSVAAVDHQNGTISIAPVGTGTASSGTITSLPNGFDKVALAASGTQPASTAYLRELPNGAGFYVDKGSSTNADGSGTQGDWGVATALQPCGTVTGNEGYNLITIAGPAFSFATSTNKAYQVGTATITSTSLNASGTSYSYTGTNLGPNTNGNNQTCSGGIFSSTNNGSGGFDSQGVIVSADTNLNMATAAHIGDMGFFAPSQPYSLSALASVRYDAASGSTGLVGGVPQTFEQPAVVTPQSGTTMTGCPYTDFENDVVGTTNCTTIAFTGQPFPGLVTGTATTANSSTSPFIAAVGQVDGKYMIDIISVDSTSGQATNIVMLQQ